jgi:uncharacterized protein (TIGR00369 family)
MDYFESYPKIRSLNPGFRKLVEKKVEGQFFMRLVGLELTDIEEGKTNAILQVDQKHRQQNGFLHGGVIGTLVDVVMGFAAFTLVPEDQHVVTAEIKITFLSPSLSKYVHARGWVLKPGKKLHFCEAEVWEQQQGKNKLIAKASSSMAVIFPEDFHKRK